MKRTFEQWLEQVNVVLRGLGLDYRDLPDCPYQDWYADGVSPKSAAKRAVKNASE